jgi:hypothetical protein
MCSFESSTNYLILTQPLNDMKKTILTLGLVVCSAAVLTNLSAKSFHPIVSVWENATFNWVQTVFDFGNIKHNVPVSHTFKFTNKGDSPLIISSVQASCGCTVTDYSKDPVMPGGEGYVKATYNAANVGVFFKTVSVYANTDKQQVVLTIKGTVVQ